MSEATLEQRVEGLESELKALKEKIIWLQKNQGNGVSRMEFEYILREQSSGLPWPFN